MSQPATNPEIPQGRYNLYVAAALGALIESHPGITQMSAATQAHNYATAAVDEQVRREHMAQSGYTNLYGWLVAGLCFAFQFTNHLI